VEEQELFFNDNRALIENWVLNGGVLFYNSAPNEGDEIADMGFGVQLFLKFIVICYDLQP
jgi:hypothetical protein